MSDRGLVLVSHGSHGVETRDVDATRRLRFSISDEQAIELARQALIIEEHYDKPMEIECALDGASGKLYIVQARPETVKSRSSANRIERNDAVKALLSMASKACP